MMDILSTLAYTIRFHQYGTPYRRTFLELESNILENSMSTIFKNQPGGEFALIVDAGGHWLDAGISALEQSNTLSETLFLLGQTINPLFWQRKIL